MIGDGTDVVGLIGIRAGIRVATLDLPSAPGTTGGPPATLGLEVVGEVGLRESREGAVSGERLGGEVADLRGGALATDIVGLHPPVEDGAARKARSRGVARSVDGFRKDRTSEPSKSRIKHLH